MAYTYWHAPLISDGGSGFVTNNTHSLQDFINNLYEVPKTGEFQGFNAAMLEAGWTVYDTNFEDFEYVDEIYGPHVPAYGDYRVWVSQGESGDKVPCYLHMYVDVLLKAHFRACAYWSLTSHTSKNAASATGWTGEALAFPAVVSFWGDKDQICLRVGNQLFLCGHVAHKWPTVAVQTTVTQTLVASVSPVTISVLDSTGFIVGHSYQIISQDPAVSGNCTDWVTVTNVADQSLTLSAVHINCDSGAFIGVCPAAFYHAYIDSVTGAMVARWTHYKNVTGDTADESYCDLRSGSIFNCYGGTSDGRTGAYNLEPLGFHDKTYPGSVGSHYGFILGMGDSRVLRLASSSAISNLKDCVYTQGILCTGDATYTAANTLTVSPSMSVETDELVGKAIAINVDGSYARVGTVSSNTSSSIEFDGYPCIPANEAVNFVVCDYVYRDVAGVGGSGLLLVANEGPVVPLFSGGGISEDYLKKLFVL